MTYEANACPACGATSACGSACPIWGKGGSGWSVKADPAIKTDQHDHQRDIYMEHRDDLYYALWWEMGLGKTKEFLDVASHLQLEGKIDALLIFAPNAVAPNWLSQEIPPHLAVPYVGMHYRTKKSGGEKNRLKMLYMLDPSEWRGKLRILTMSYDSLRTDRGFEFARKFVAMYRTMIVADESTAMKNGKTVTAKKAKEIRAFCHYAWIGTGTPVAQSPFDCHSQVEFLDPTFWKNHGLMSLQAFKQEFGIFVLKHVGGGKKVSSLSEYKRLDYLQKILAPISSRLLKEDSTVKLPPKIYTTREFTLSEAQVLAYESLRDEFTALLDSGEIVEAPLAITRIMRLQQICSGYVTADVYEEDEHPGQGILVIDDPPLENEIRVDEESKREVVYDWFTKTIPSRVGPDASVAQGSFVIPAPTPLKVEKRIVDLVEPKDNPRLQLLLELLEEAQHKVIVWCRFTRDVEIVCEALGDECVRYDGKTSKALREQALIRFRDPKDKARIFVANQHAISQGVTLVIAKTVIYYTNSSSPEKRLQSEDRAHRIGQDVSVQIIDIVAKGTVDIKILEAHIKKHDIAAMVTGDRWREWISLSPKEVDDE